ncbi:GyrI-like domain-containing protein [Kribbella catacumbae]|uniref:GyrI-like domain-containing protein n=1 Tax=Kribbella catacumbae TaxID=460086 RepID=UPI0003A9352A|nr:GyrI-like domain-containing protein [Kribbella catacumbae]
MNPHIQTKYVEPLTIAAFSAPAADASRQSTGAVVQALFDQVITQMESAAADRTTPIARYVPAAGTPAVEVAAGYAIAGTVPGLSLSTLPATEVASLIHHGPMNTISTAYQALTHWAESAGHSPTTSTWREQYLEANGNDQSTWIVELQLELPTTSTTP